MDLALYLGILAVVFILTVIVSSLMISKFNGKGGISGDESDSVQKLSVEDQAFEGEEDDSEDDDEDQPDLLYEYVGEWLYHQWLLSNEAQGFKVKGWIELSEEEQDKWSAFFTQLQPWLKRA